MKSTKKSLLLSTISLVLCFAMLLGTTWAWFTDEVTSGVNQIKAGNLDVELYAGDTQVTESTQLFNIEHWEPGMVAYENFMVKNVGNLALKYQLAMTVGDFNETVDGNHTLKEVLKVAVVPGGFTGTTRTEAEALSGYTTLEEFSTSSNGALLPGAAGDTFGVVIYWQPTDNDNLYNLNNGKKATVVADKFSETELGIELGVKLVAAQLESEADSFGTDYDAGAEVEIPVVISTKTIDASADTVISVAATPANEDGKQTTVTFPKEIKAFADNDGKTTTMTVEAATTIAANNKFTVGSGDEGAVGAIDLTVKVNDEVVSQFKDDSDVPVTVKVETYVAKNLTNVTFAYGGTNWTKVDTEAEVEANKFFYDKDSGKLVFGTTHFSTFVLGADEVAYVEETNMAYKTFEEAIDEAAGKEISLIKDIKTTAAGITIASDKTVVLDLNGRKLSADHAASGQTYVVKNQGTLTINDSSSDKQGQISIDNGSGYRNDQVLYLEGGSTTTINSGRIVTEGYYPVYVVQATEATGKTTFTMNDGYISGGYYGLYLNGGKIGANVALDATINGGDIITTFYERNVRMYAATQGFPPNMTFKNYVKQFDVCGYPIQTYYDTNLTIRNATLDYYGPFVTDEYIAERLAAVTPPANEVANYGEPTNENTVVDIDITCCPVSIDEGNKNATTKISIQNSKLGFYERDGSNISQYEKTSYNPNDFYYPELLAAWFTVTEDAGVYTLTKK